MPFADSHCHLDFAEFDGCRDQLIADCAQHDIELFVVPGVARKSWDRLLMLPECYSQIKVALGLHPYFVKEHQEKDLETQEAFLVASRSDVVAVGEIGLDDEKPEFERQCYFFEEQLKLAERFELPVIMHVRKNQGQGLKRVRRYSLVGGVVHAFSGSLVDAKAWIELGMKIGVGGVITYQRASKTRSTIAQLPLDSLVLETDSPDMAVSGMAAGSGNPMMLDAIFKSLCDLREESPDVLRQALWRNTKTLFRLP